jgi:hypothetical protein
MSFRATLTLSDFTGRTEVRGRIRSSLSRTDISGRPHVPLPNDRRILFLLNMGFTLALRLHVQPHPLHSLHFHINSITPVPRGSEGERISLFELFAKDSEVLLASWRVDYFTGRTRNGRFGRVDLVVGSRVGNFGLGVSTSSNSKSPSSSTENKWKTYVHEVGNSSIGGSLREVSKRRVLLHVSLCSSIHASSVTYWEVSESR